MGDVAMTVPVVRALRKSYPDLKITVLTKPFYAPFFRGIHNMRFFHLNVKVRHKGFWGLFRLAADAKNGGVDAVADMQGNFESWVIRKLLELKGCRVASIDKGKVSKRRLSRRGYLNFHPLRSTFDRYADVLKDLGLEVVPESQLDMTLPMPLAINYLHGPKSGAWVGIAPFAKYQPKIYPIELMEAVVRLLSVGVQKIFIFGGGHEERRLAEQLASQADNVVSVIGVMSLGDELNLISNLDVMLTMDSVSMQMASLVGTPVVSVWGATHPYAGNYPLGQSPDNAVQLPLECRPCSISGVKPCRWGNYRCLNDIPPARIVEKVLYLCEL